MKNQAAWYIGLTVFAVGNLVLDVVRVHELSLWIPFDCAFLVYCGYRYLQETDYI